VAILYDHYTNATAQRANGVDLSIRDTFSLTKGDLGVFANATWLRVRQQTLPTQPERTLSGRIYYAPKFRARGGVSWQSGGLSTAGFVNFLASSLDTGVNPAAKIGSWMTFDATVSYRFTSQHWSLSGVKVLLSATNLLDQMPPRTYSAAATLPQVDLTNTSILGRYLSLTVSKAW
ncbi:MAG: hypothetical protein B7Z26_11975, partial [Asticcacaulis sp. 32-58-5]